MSGKSKSGVGSWIGTILFVAAVLAFGYLVYFGK